MSQTFTYKLAGAISVATLVALGIIAAKVSPAAAQQFDCRKAEYASERTICKHGSLGALDERMNDLYSELMETSGRGQRNNIKQYQRRFLDARDGCGHDANCIQDAYEDQISVLETRLDGGSRRSER